MREQRRIYEEIAESWYGLRHHTRFSSELEELRRRWKGGRLLNLGCAHGPDFLPFRGGDFELIGVDFSKNMLLLAKKYREKFRFKAELVLADLRFLPFADSSFDWIISIASLHNIKGREERRKALREMSRVLRPGGEMFITVWNRWQRRFWPFRKEVLVPWRRKGEVFLRYYYLYTPFELRREVRSSGFEILEISPERSFLGKIPRPLAKILPFWKNICVLARKPPRY